MDCSGTGRSDGNPVICFRIRDKRRIDSDSTRHRVPLADYLILLIRTFMNTISREYLNEALWINTIIIESDGLSPLEFRMTPEQKKSALSRRLSDDP
jgi:NTE family protein